MKKLLIATALAGGAALALVHCRDMMHNHGREWLAGRHPQQPRRWGANTARRGQPVDGGTVTAAV
jgi:hypothetical protein